MINCKYGHFSDNGKEFIITNPFTPKPWINVISNGDYSLIVSQMGGGFSFRNNAEQNRLTRLFQDLIKDNWGKYFYIRDRKTGKYFSSTMKPIMDKTSKYEVRHGIGYSTFVRETLELRVEMTIFVSPSSPMEYFLFKITNLSSEERYLDVTSYFEWAPGIAYDNHREYQKLFSDVNFDSEHKAIKITKCLWGFPDEKGRYNNDDWPYTGFFATSLDISSYDCDKEKFLGNYNDEKTAIAMENDELSLSHGRFGDPVSSLRSHLNLSKKQSKEFVYTLGMASLENEDVDKFISNTTVEKAKEELIAVGKFWDNLLDNEIVKTNDDEFDVFTNIWSKYQAISCRLFAKAAYYQISGGIGYRDQLQDSLIYLESNPNLTKKQILLHASKQFIKGDVYHWWLTIKPWGPRGNCSDDFLWLPFAVIQYIKETHDYSILKEEVCYVDGEKEQIYEHIKKAFGRSFSMFSPRGIPLMGDNDWNDGLSAVGHDLKGESFWVAEFLYYILNNINPICDYMNDEKYLDELMVRKETLKENFNKYAFDGEYYLQATNDIGQLIGSHTTKEGSIYLNPQIWAVISDIVDEEHKKIAMDAVTKYLLKDYGCVLLYPAYTVPDKNIGYVTRYAPGLRENGGVYTHAACWAVWAYALMGDSEKAFKAYQGILPPHRSKDIDLFESEPYVTPGNSDGPISPHYGKGGWSWYSGSAQWLHNVAIKAIIGVKGEYDGLHIVPCLPSSINGYSYERVFFDKKIHVEVRKTGKEVLLVNGKDIKGNVVPLDENTKKYEIYMEIK